MQITIGLLLPLLHLCHFSPGLIELVRTSSKMFNRSGESRHLRIVPDLKGKKYPVFIYSVISYRLHVVVYV